MSRKMATKDSLKSSAKNVILNALTSNSLRRDNDNDP